jgi:hypothetical protein
MLRTVRPFAQEIRMKGLNLIVATFVVGVAGCTLPLIGDGHLDRFAAEHEATLDTTEVAPPVVQVRDFPHSSVANVFAWEPDDAQMGLSTSITLTGKLVGGLRAGDHQLYIDVVQARLMGGFKYATVAPDQLLLRINTRRDPQACFNGKVCSPMISLGVRIPDSLLRARRDSLVVTFHPVAMQPWTVTLRPELITAYLQRVDSVVASR